MGAGSGPSLNVSVTGARSGRGWGGEAGDELMKDGLELGIVLRRVGANEVDDFAVAVGRLFLIASGLVDHSETIPAIMHIGEARDEVAGGLLGLVELARMDEVDGSVGRRGQLVLGIVDAGVGGGEAFGDFRVRWAFAPGRRDGRERTGRARTVRRCGSPSPRPTA